MVGWAYHVKAFGFEILLGLQDGFHAVDFEREVLYPIWRRQVFDVAGVFRAFEERDRTAVLHFKENMNMRAVFAGRRHIVRTQSVRKF